MGRIGPHGVANVECANCDGSGFIETPNTKPGLPRTVFIACPHRNGTGHTCPGGEVKQVWYGKLIRRRDNGIITLLDTGGNVFICQTCGRIVDSSEVTE